MARIKVAFMKDVFGQLSRDEISFSRMCELLNEEAARKEINPVAYEWHNHKSGHCYVDYIPHADQDEEDGYIKKPLFYAKENTSFPLRFRG